MTRPNLYSWKCVGGCRDGTKPLVGYALKLTLHGRSWCGLGRASEGLPSKREIKFTKSCRSRRNPPKSSKLPQNTASCFSPFCSPSVRNLGRFATTCTTFSLRRESSHQTIQVGKQKTPRLQVRHERAHQCLRGSRIRRLSQRSRRRQRRSQRKRSRASLRRIIS